MFAMFCFLEVGKFRDSVNFRIEFAIFEKSNQKKKKNRHSAKRPRYEFRATVLRNAGR